jgi:DNA adenine methylase
LVEQLRLTPFAREEFEQSFEVSDEPVERARRLIVLSFMGFGANAHSRYQTGFRSNSNRSGTTPATDWRNYPDMLPLAIERLRGVVIESQDARKCMAKHDALQTLHYVDPPYVMSTRWKGDPTGRERRGYCHELSDDDHAELLTFLRGLRGMVVLSAYAHPIYEQTLSDWRRIEIDTYADGARPRTEIVWLNPTAATALSDGPLLDRIAKTKTS